MGKLPLETLMLVNITGHDPFYSFKVKGLNYDKKPTINIGSQEIPNARTLHFDINLIRTEEPKTFLREAYHSNIKAERTIATDDIIIAKFELIYALMTKKSAASIALERLINIIDNNSDIVKLQIVTDRLNELVEEINEI